VGVKPGFRPAIVDGTAGLGRDGFLLASLGCNVMLVESDPVIHALLEDALRRAALSDQSSLCETARRMTLILGNFCHLAAEFEPVDVVYLDPMFPVRGKAARVKKEMYVLQQYFTAANQGGGSEPELLHAAQSLALRRVVVKRPRLAQPLAGVAPNHSLTGSSSRYDVYLRT
ncbi:MAG: class I SAM-dependent methyltransferase, partial [Pseudohongiellaceae bacterium]